MPGEDARTIEAVRKELPRILQGPTKSVLLYVGIGAVLLFLMLSARDVWVFKRALPAALETDGFVASNNNMNFFISILPLRHEPCGGFAFRLSQATIRSIELQGISFFDNARQARGFQGRNQPSYAPWQQTPLPAGWIDPTERSRPMGGWGLSCTGWLDKPLGRSILAAVAEQGSYYTTARSILLLVMPRERMVILTYYH